MDDLFYRLSSLENALKEDGKVFRKSLSGGRSSACLHSSPFCSSLATLRSAVSAVFLLVSSEALLVAVSIDYFGDRIMILIPSVTGTYS